MDIQVDNLILKGDLSIPSQASALVIFAHGSGSSRHSPRNQFVAKQFNKAGLATLLFDLLTEEEEIIDNQTRELRFDIDLLANRLIKVITYMQTFSKTKGMQKALFGASTGAAVALIAAAQSPKDVYAVVSRGGRPDLAEKYLSKVQAATLLIVGGDDRVVIGMNEQAFAQMTCTKKMEIVPHASHLFEEKGKLEIVADLAKNWFLQQLIM